MYDQIGETTSRPGATGQQTLVWDALGHVSSVTEGSATTSYAYSASGDGLISRDASGSTLYLPDNTELHVGPGGTNPTGSRRYALADRVVATRTGSGGVSWLFSDPRGTATVAIRASDSAILRQYETPFGTSRGTVSSWPDIHGFVGGVADGTGLVHLGAREYDPAAGRFVSVDPVADTDSPQQMQGYSYANNSPATLSDPTGREPGSWCNTSECSAPRDAAYAAAQAAGAAAAAEAATTTSNHKTTLQRLANLVLSGLGSIRAQAPLIARALADVLNAPLVNLPFGPADYVVFEVATTTTVSTDPTPQGDELSSRAKPTTKVVQVPVLGVCPGPGGTVVICTTWKNVDVAGGEVQSRAQAAHTDSSTTVSITIVSGVIVTPMARCSHIPGPPSRSWRLTARGKGRRNPRPSAGGICLPRKTGKLVQTSNSRRT